MTQDEIIEMARQAGLTSKLFIAVQPKYTVLDPNIETFAKLVAKKEREACAKIADEYAEQVFEHNFSKLIAHNIRARGEA